VISRERLSEDGGKPEIWLGFEGITAPPLAEHDTAVNEKAKGTFGVRGGISK